MGNIIQVKKKYIRSYLGVKKRKKLFEEMLEERDYLEIV